MAGGIVRQVTALLGQRVIVQLALLAQDFRQAPHGIRHLLFFLRDILLIFTIGLRARHAGHARPALPALEIEVLQHVGNVGQKLAGLFRGAGIGQVLQGIQHVLEILPAKALAATGGHAVLVHVRHLAAIGHGFGHPGGKVFIGRIAEGFHPPADFLFRGAIAQGLFQRAAGSLQPSQRIGRVAIFGLQRQRPEQGIDRLGLFLRAGGFQHAFRHLESQVVGLVRHIALTHQRDGVEHQGCLLNIRRGDVQPVGRICIDCILPQGREVRLLLRIIPRLTQNGDAHFLRHTSDRIEEELFGQDKRHRLAGSFLSGGIGHDELHIHRQARPAVARQVDLGRVLDVRHGGRGKRDRHAVFLIGGCRVRLPQAQREFSPHDAVIILCRPCEFRPVETAIGGDGNELHRGRIVR